MLRNSTDDIVIRTKLPVTLKVILGVVALLVVIGASVLGYHSGRTVIANRLDNSLAENTSLQEQVAVQEQYRINLQKELEQANSHMEETKSSLAKARRQLQIDQAAYQELRNDLDNSNQQIAELANEIKFYRSIISPADGRSGVRIQAFEINKTQAPSEFRYKLILIQALEHEVEVDGSVRFEIVGQLGEQVDTVTVPTADENGIPAKFKYFQNLVGSFELPQGFLPAQVKVVFAGNDQENAQVQSVFPWPDLG